MTAALVFMCHDRLFFCGIAAAAVHESGHILAIWLCRGCFLREINIGALGIRITAGGRSFRPVIILAGVTANLVLTLLSLPFLSFEPYRDYVIELIAANLCLAACNILPVEPLDGGSLLRYFTELKLSQETADKVVFIVSLCAIVPLAAAGLFAVMQSRGNFSLLILCLWLLAGILRRYI